MRRRYLATKDMCEIWPRRGWIALPISEPKSRVTAMLRPISQPKGQYKRDHVAPSGSFYLCNLNYRCPYGFPRRLRTRKTKPAIDFKFRVCVNFLQAMATAISSMGATGNNVVWRGMMINDGSGWKKSSMTGYGSAQLNARLWSCRTSGKPVRAQPVMGNKNEGKGLFAPLVVLARNIIGKKPFNQLRGKAIALHSQVITEFCKSIGADAKQRQGLIRLAKKNGEKLGFLA